MAGTVQDGVWSFFQTKSPMLADSVTAIAAKNVPYTSAPNQYQKYNVYLPMTDENAKLIGTVFNKIPCSDENHSFPRYHVHIHGGAWRDPDLTALSIESEVAHAFFNENPPIKAIIGINYTLSPFPTHPTRPYDPSKGDHGQPGREARHPQHVRDVLTAFNQLRSQGLMDGSFVLTAHSCGACIAFQAVLRPVKEWGIPDLAEPPRPAAIIGMNGLYHLPALVDDLGKAHEHLRDDYISLISQAFGSVPEAWDEAAPALFDPDEISEHVRNGMAPKIAVLDQSTEDQLVPVNQREYLESCLRKVHGMRVIKGNRCFGRHAAPWERGDMIWQLVQDVLKLID